MSTIILKVDLQCYKCNKKIRKVLCDLQDRWNIQAIVYDEKNGIVTVSGNFDPEKLIKKLCCKACKVIKEIEIKKPDPPPPPPSPPPPAEVPAPAPPPPDPVPPPAEEPPKPAEEPPKPVEEPPKPAPPPQEEPAKPAPQPVEEPKPAPPPQEEPKKSAPEPAPPAMQYLFYGPACCCWYHGACRCCSCGRAAACVPAPQPCPPVGYGVPYYEGYKTYELISDEDRSCRIM